MKVDVHCPQCNTKYQLEDSTVPPQGASLTCKNCGHRWQTRRQELGRYGAAVGSVGRAAAAGSIVACPGCGLRFVPGTAPHPAAGGGAAASAEEPAAGRPGQKTILVVEDIDYFTALAKNTLGAKYRTITVGNVADARRVLARESIDLLVLDLTLQEGEDGREILRTLENKDFPVLIFTARDESDMYGEVWADLQRLGADDMLIKGLNVEENLLQKVGALLAGRK